jgi:hypothetical protein
MPVEEATVLNITCDNPACPGNDLDPRDRIGWLFVSHEIYGEPVHQHVFCSYGCVSAASGNPQVIAALREIPGSVVEEAAAAEEE